MRKRVASGQAEAKWMRAAFSTTRAPILSRLRRMEELERQLVANAKKERKDRLSLLQIHEDLASQGNEGGYDAVRRYARVWRRRRRLLSPSQAFVPLIFDPGEAYQFDWSHEYAVLSGTTNRVKAAHMRLCHSRMQLVQIFPRESREMLTVLSI